MSDLERLVTEIARREAELAVGSPRPLFVTRHNCEQVLGLPWRTVRDWTKTPDFPVKPVIRGKSILVELEPLLKWLRECAERESAAEEPSDEDNEALSVLKDVMGPEVRFVS